jgi:hypothetical protein
MTLARKFLQRLLAVVVISVFGVTIVETTLLLARTAPMQSSSGAAKSAGSSAAGASLHEPPQASPTSTPSVAQTSTCTKQIEVNLTTQYLVASTCDIAELAAPITSGRAGLRTPTGTFSIYLKKRNVYFISRWPRGDPNYYPPMFVAYAMEFLDGGYYLHSDPDEPEGAYGRGSENGPYRSHGCVHVPYSVMESLFAWTPNGTTVHIHY